MESPQSKKRGKNEFSVNVFQGYPALLQAANKRKKYVFLLLFVAFVLVCNK